MFGKRNDRFARHLAPNLPHGFRLLDTREQADPVPSHPQNQDRAGNVHQSDGFFQTDQIANN